MAVRSLFGALMVSGFPAFLYFSLFLVFGCSSSPYSLGVLAV
jgi:hypothetical protein